MVMCLSGSVLRYYLLGVGFGLPLAVKLYIYVPANGVLIGCNAG
jgi:hypothetical protein